MNNKAILIILFLLLSSLNMFPSEQNNLEIDTPQEKINNSYEISKLSNHIAEIFAGASLLGMIAVPTNPAVSLVLTPMWYGTNIALGTVLLILEVPLIAVGGALLGYGSYYFPKKYQNLQTKSKHSLLKYKCSNYKIFGIVTGVLSGIFCSGVIPGTSLAFLGYYTNDTYIAPEHDAIWKFSQRIITSPTCTVGVTLAIISGIGLGICLPMMIASLAIAHWCKGQATKFTPDISLTHDDKKSFNEG